jgi:hypothetical protein
MKIDMFFDSSLNLDATLDKENMLWVFRTNMWECGGGNWIWFTILRLIMTKIFTGFLQDRNGDAPGHIANQKDPISIYNHLWRLHISYESDIKITSYCYVTIDITFSKNPKINRRIDRNTRKSSGKLPEFHSRKTTSSPHTAKFHNPHKNHPILPLEKWLENSINFRRKARKAYSKKRTIYNKKID